MYIRFAGAIDTFSAREGFRVVAPFSLKIF
jgi:hypothetical protein